MKFSVILSISKTHLFSRKKQTIIAALGVTFGIGAYIIMMSFMTGLNGLLDGMVLNRTPHIHLFNEVKQSEKQPIDKDDEYKDFFRVVHSIKPTESQTKVNNASAIMSYLNEQPYVKGATPMVRAQAFYMAGTSRLNGSIIGVDVLKEAEFYNLNDYIINGDVKDLAVNENGILMGIGVAKILSLKVGDVVQVSSTSSEVFPLKIVGFFQSGLADVDKIQSYVNIKTAQRLMGQPITYITDINIKLYDMEKAPEISKDLRAMFDLSVVDIQTANAQFETGTSIRNLISYAVSITLLIVAGFGIYNILNMLIYEKMNDIAILKATGFSGRDVQLIFISQALIIGFIGGILGLILGYGVSVLISHAPFETEALPTVKTMPVDFSASYYIIGIIFAMISTFFAGYFPSKKAQRIDPVEIIRGQ
ncbi:MAG: lipoprotein-releasing system permease protein [Crocinitomicaceae bacterium]|jgi:lipoprotein-releasing system permease protein